MSVWHGSLKKKKPSGGRKKAHRVKRKFEKGSFPAETIMGEPKRKIVRGKGGNVKEVEAIAFGTLETVVNTGGLVALTNKSDNWDYSFYISGRCYKRHSRGAAGGNSGRGIHPDNRAWRRYENTIGDIGAYRR